MVLGLKSLLELNLNDNSITQLSTEGFKDLNNLILLRMAYNKISSLQRNHLKGLWRIKNIDLSNNNPITNTDRHLLQGFTFLQALDLYPNSYAGLGALNVQGLNYLQF